MIEFWGQDISRFIWFCAAGKSFFPGAGLLAIALIFASPDKHVKVFISYILLVIAAIMIVLSATPLPVWFYALWSGGILCNIFLPWHKKTAKRVVSVAAIVLCVIAVLIELPFHFQPSLDRGDFDCVYTIGDSISAGIAAMDERPWPGIFRDEYGVEVIDLSAAGATVTSALSQARRIDRPDAIVFIEIGGNDLFENTPYNLFEQGLSQLLEKAAESERMVVMLELPLRPRDIRYGRIQRRLAGKYGAVLVPKHFFARLFSTKGATVDLVHLSQAGHQLMAERVWNLLKDSLGRGEAKVEQSPTSRQ
jgi:acyl-CoA thioesterase-1